MARILFFIVCIGFIDPFCFSQHAGDFLFEPAEIDGIRGFKITMYMGTAKNIVIPSAFKGRPVIEIGEQAFMAKGLSDVLIPEGILVIGRQAFLGNQLREVSLPRTASRVDQFAFENNPIVNIYGGMAGNKEQPPKAPPPRTIPEQSAHQTTGAFYLQNLGSGMAAISGYRPYYKDAIIPSQIGDFTVTRIGAGAFAWKNLNSVVIPPTVEYIGDAAFTGNQFDNIHIPESVRYIGNQAFSSNQLKTVSLGDGVILKIDSFLHHFSEFYTLNGKMAGTYIWNEAAWEYLSDAGQRSILREYIVPDEIKAIPQPY
ncbi:MAG: leucine-rich repeat domain-containing protein [Spirochaetaceae bacterium]|jgi:hypothetical protein|nr:leucine-rich repeat domain-containing protein [Spirochaetaceae bacterium]